MRYSVFISATALILSTIPCQARLGETMDQCIARYGQPSPAKDNTVPGGLGDSYAVFQKSGFTITVIIFKGTVGAESMTKIDGSDFSDNEKQNFLDADSASLHWTKPENYDASQDVWIRDDKAAARYDAVNHSMTIMSKEFWDAAQAKSTADENAKMKGF